MDVRSDECLENNEVNGNFGKHERFCELIFDGILCWPATKAGEIATQPCPLSDISFSVIHALENATKRCEPDGTWHVDEQLNRTWSDYSLCNLTIYDDTTAIINNNLDITIAKLVLYNTWLPVIKITSHLGYYISLLTLLLSVFIIVSIKKLQCSRNILHAHLFVSFIMRALMFMLKELVLVEGLALKTDVVMVKGKIEYTTEHYSWICKAITISRNYFIQTNYLFILMEGIYLHNLMFLNLFSEKSNIGVYYILGWGIPLIFMTIWTVLRKLYDDNLCWTTSNNKYISRFIQTPIEISVLANFFLFISITRILCLKINSMYMQQKKIKYRHLIRSTMTLVLIYGVPFTISIIISYSNDDIIELIWIFCDQTFTAFQGLFLALIYCLLNREVQTEVRHKYNSIRERQQYNLRSTRRTRTISNTQQCSIPLQEEHHPTFQNCALTRLAAYVTVRIIK